MSTTDHPPPSPSDEPFTDEPVTEEDVASLAAGELDASRAAALRSRALANPALADRVAEAEKLEASLRQEELLPVPLAMLADVLERVRAEPAPSWSLRPEHPAVRALSQTQRALRVAAALLLAAVGLWVTIGGFEPVAATAGTIAAATPSAIREPSWLTSVSGADHLPSIDGLLGKGRDVASLTAAVPEHVPVGLVGWLLGSVAFLAAGLGLAWKLSKPDSSPRASSPRIPGSPLS